MAKNKEGVESGIVKMYMRWPFYIGIPFIPGTVVAFVLDKNAGMVSLFCTLVYILLAALVYFKKSQGVFNALTKFAANCDSIQNRLIKEMVIPYAVLDGDGGVIWGNKGFYEIVDDDKAAKKSITNVIPDISEDLFPEEGKDEVIHIIYNDVNYKVLMRNIEIDDLFDDTVIWDSEEKSNNRFIAIYLYDETEITRYIKENNEQKTVVGLLYIDNYEEALESVDEVKRSLLIALVERKITKYLQSIDAIVKRLEKDKYIVVFRKKYLEQLKENKFSLLDEVRTISVGNEINITLSMGLGVDANTLLANYEYARTSIDLALGRGGDQVVVKSGDKIEYFGGKSLQVEKNTRVRARVKAHALREILEAKEDVFVMGHSIADVDCFGAAVGIFRIAKALGKKAYIVLDTVNTSLRPIVERVKAEPEYSDSVIISSSSALEIAGPNSVLVIVDVNRAGYTECPQLLNKIKTKIVLDHHRQTGDAIEGAVLSYIEPFASSACEMVAEILQYIDDGLKLRPGEADAMYAGMVIDTDNFQSKTGVRTFEAAAYLRRSGADIVRIRKALRTDRAQMQVKAEAIKNVTVFCDNFAVTECKSQGLESPTIVGAQVANELLDIVGVKASFVLTNYNDKVYVSARSIDEVNVQVIMEKFGGGGHLGMAGAQFEGANVEEVARILKITVKEMLENGEL